MPPPLPVISIRPASSASAEISVCSTVLFARLCTSPSRVRYLHSPCPALHFQSCSFSELARSPRPSPIAITIRCNNVSDSPALNPASSAILISYSSFLITVSASSTCCHTTLVSLSTSSWIPFSFSALSKKYVSCVLSAPSIFLDRKLHTAPRVQTPSGSEPRLSSFRWWQHRVECFHDWLDLTTGSGRKLSFGAFSIMFDVDFVVRRDIGCCMIWTIWRHAASFISRLIHLINLNCAKWTFWLSLQWE